MFADMAKRDLHNVLFPKQRKILTYFGEDLLLAMKRRGFTKKLLCERTGFDAGKLVTQFQQRDNRELVSVDLDAIDWQSSRTI